MKTLTFTLPTSKDDIKIGEKFGFLKSAKNSVFNSVSKASKSTKSSFRDVSKKMKMTGGMAKVPEGGTVKKIVIALVVIAVIVVGINALKGDESPSQNGDGRVEIMPAKATQQLDKSYTFPLTDSKGDVVSEIKFEIRKAELKDEIIVQGQRATSVKGRTFLILDLLIKNDNDASININTRDYVRLSVNGDDENRKAPEIHNDPVQIQPISTKETRLGFTINDTDENIVLFVGEINGDKDKIELSF